MAGMSITAQTIAWQLPWNEAYGEGNWGKHRGGEHCGRILFRKRLQNWKIYDLPIFYTEWEEGKRKRPRLGRNPRKWLRERRPQNGRNTVKVNKRKRRAVVAEGERHATLPLPTKYRQNGENILSC